MKKIYICIGKTPIDGYDHYDPAPKGNVPAFTGAISDIDCDQAECIELLAPEILDTIPNKDLEKYIGFFASLIRHGGKLILGGTEINELSRLFFIGAISEEEYNQIVFAGSFKRGLHSCSRVKEYIQNLDFKINKVTLSGPEFIIEAIRP